jgi:membrane protein implicated in regulation of membrane protease activity
VFSFDSSAAAWIALAIVAGILEITIPQFGVIFVSLAALVSAAAAALGANLVIQLIAFVITLVLSLTLLRPRLVSQLDSKGVPHRTEALIGREGIITHDIDATVGAGRVNVGGEDWAARAATRLPAGTRVRVMKADGIVLEVTPL